MKKLLIVPSLVLFLGVISYTNSEAKVLPVIEGSELLDTLASQNNEDLNNMPVLNAGIYNFVDLEYLNDPLIGFLSKNSPSTRPEGYLKSCYIRIHPFHETFNP